MSVSVGLGHYHAGAATREPWIIYGLGSCIGLILCDPCSRLSALAHVVLPERLDEGDAQPAKYADVVVPYLIQTLTSFGARRDRLRAVMAGGARMLQLSLGDIGARNAATLTAALRAARIPLVAARLGGRRGRTLRWEPAACRVVISSVGFPPEVIDLKTDVCTDSKADGLKEVGDDGTGAGR